MWARPEGFSTFKADALKSDKFSFLAAIPFAGLCRRKLAGGSAYSQIAQSKRDTTEVVSLLLGAPGGIRTPDLLIRSQPILVAEERLTGFLPVFLSTYQSKIPVQIAIIYPAVMPGMRYRWRRYLRKMHPALPGRRYG